ncbi:hypothetical protein GEMRC1_004081 [Eukaryota sp. GEM-RC1]
MSSQLESAEQLLQAVQEHASIRIQLQNVQEAFDKKKLIYERSEDHLRALQCCGQLIGELLRQIDEDRYAVRALSGSRYVVGCKKNIDRDKLVSGARVALDISTLTIMRILPREVDPSVHHMITEDPGQIGFSSVGGLADQLRQVREVVELPLTNPELFTKVGITPP